MIIFLGLLLIAILFAIALKNAIDNDDKKITVASVISIFLVIIMMAISSAEVELNEIKTKKQTLEQVGYEQITEDEMMDLSPNELKQYTHVGGVYYRLPSDR